MNQINKYSFSFTGAAAMISETLVVAEEYNRLNDWILVEKSLIENNLLNKVKQATFKREFREIKKRLSLLTHDQLQIMIHGGLDDAKAMILLSLVKTYSFFKDFIVEILSNKYLLFDYVLTETDYTKFFNAKSLSHVELNEITEATSNKVKQRVFTLLEQVGLITKTENGIILRPILSKETLNAILKEDPALLSSFLFSKEEIKVFLLKFNKDE